MKRNRKYKIYSQIVVKIDEAIELAGKVPDHSVETALDHVREQACDEAGVWDVHPHSICEACGSPNTKITSFDDPPEWSPNPPMEGRFRYCKDCGVCYKVGD